MTDCCTEKGKYVFVRGPSESARETGVWLLSEVIRLCQHHSQAMYVGSAVYMYMLTSFIRPSAHTRVSVAVCLILTGA